MLPLDTSLRAEYEDGYVLDETGLEDQNPWGEGNVFTAVLNKLPEVEHGRLVSLVCYWRGMAYRIDWTLLPGGARPVRLRHGYSTIERNGTVVASGWSGVDFGWQATVDGRDVQEITELREEGIR